MTVSPMVLFDVLEFVTMDIVSRSKIPERSMDGHLGSCFFGSLFIYFFCANFHPLEIQLPTITQPFNSGESSKSEHNQCQVLIDSSIHTDSFCVFVAILYPLAFIHSSSLFPQRWWNSVDFQVVAWQRNQCGISWCFEEHPKKISLLDFTSVEFAKMLTAQYDHIWKSESVYGNDSRFEIWKPSTLVHWSSSRKKKSSLYCI